LFESEHVVNSKFFLKRSAKDNSSRVEVSIKNYVKIANTASYN